MIYKNIFDIEKHILNTHYSFATHQIYPHRSNWRVFDILARLDGAINREPAMVGANFDAEILVDGEILKTSISINRLDGDMYDGKWEVIEQLVKAE